MTVIHDQLLKALQVAGAQGVPEHEIVELGGRWWRKRLLELNGRDGVSVGEWDGFYYLVSGPDVLAGMDSGVPVVSVPQPDALRLFTPPSGSHYDE